MINNKIIRIDDIGASTKHFNQHGRTFGFFPLANFWFFKRWWLFRGWAKYDELTVEEWKGIIDVFVKFKIVPIIAITATWVDQDSKLIPFPEKFPEQAKFLKEVFREKKIIIANHGLTHCVVGKHLPLFWGSNRHFHREFLPSIDESIHNDHIIKSQKILEDYFEDKITILVPPGNIWSIKTYQALLKTNIKTVMSKNYMADSLKPMSGVKFIPDSDNVWAFHDRELKLFGLIWLKNKLQAL